jgi:predicted kinase
MPSAVRLVVIAGGFQSGKMPLARRLMGEDAGLVLVHRDTIRDALVTPVDEWIITLLMGDMVARLLKEGHSVIVCAWNMEPEDLALWEQTASWAGVALEWMDTRTPEVQALIPPLAA